MPKTKDTAQTAEVLEETKKPKTTRKRAVKAADTAAEQAPEKKTTRRTAKKDTAAPKKAAEAKAEAPAETPAEPAPKKTRKPRATDPAKKRAASRKSKVPVEETLEAPVVEAPVVEAPVVEAPATEVPVVEAPAAEVPVVEAPAAEAPIVEVPVAEEEPQRDPSPRRSIAFIGSECYPFVKTGGLGDVMYALPKALSRMNCDVKVILPRYRCIPWEYQRRMVYRGEFQMPLCSDGRTFYVGIMEYVWDGVVYDFIDNQEFFGDGNPYTSIVQDIPKYCFFSKAALAALNFMDWIPDVIHCHDWQAALVPVYQRTLFAPTPVGRAKTMFTIHNLRFQGIYNIPTLRYWTGLPDQVFRVEALKEGSNDANMLKGGLTYADVITTVSGTYAKEIQTAEYGEKLDAHLRYHAGKLLGIVNGIDVDIWNPATDSLLPANYDITNVLSNKKENKQALQEELGLEQDDHKFVIGLVSRLTDQKGLDLINAIAPQILDAHTQLVVLGTGDKRYEESFRQYENAHKGSVSASILYDEGRAHRIYAGCDAVLVPSQFEPCGLTQLIGMHYGTIPIVRETGGLKDTVEPHNEFTHEGNGFTFDRYEASLLLDAINRAKTLYFTNRYCWDEMVQRDMAKDVSWENSAQQYRSLYLDMTRR